MAVPKVVIGAVVLFVGLVLVFSLRSAPLPSSASPGSTAQPLRLGSRAATASGNSAGQGSEHSKDVPARACGTSTVNYPEWPEGFNVSVNAVFIVGEQKSGSTWLWEMLNAHPCLLTAAQPYKRMGAITTKETYYFTSTKIGTDGRELLVPWLGYSNASFALTDEAWQSIGDDWFERARVIADKGTANSSSEYFSARTYVTPPKKLAMQPCTKYYILEVALASLKEPVWRMRSAYNQFVGNFKRDCDARRPKEWCPVYKYYQLRPPSYAQMLQQELQYLQNSGAAPTCCSFEGETEKSWMDCFGCAVMDPWRDKVSNIHIIHPPYAPSAALSMYAEMLRAWLDYWPAQQMVALNYEDLVARPEELVNGILQKLGVEQYSQQHWEILQPQRLGFKGSGSHETEPEALAAEATMASFFKPHNQRLSALMAKHRWPWTPFNDTYAQQ